MKRANILWIRGGNEIQEHAKNMIKMSKLTDDMQQQLQDERDSAIDFINHYRLVDTEKVQGYVKAFAVEDFDRDFVVDYKVI